MSLENMTIGQIQQLFCNGGSPAPSNTGPWEIGKAYVIRTVTMINVGILTAVTDNELVLTDAAWIADTGRYSEFLAGSSANEIEPYANDCIVGRGGIIDATEWAGTLPLKVK
jgi:hypothetical protein